MALFSQAPQRGFKKNRPRKNETLVNEKLIRFLVRRPSAPSAQNVQVRLLVDEGSDKASNAMIVPLDEAVKTSTSLGFDLVGINLEQNPPVIKAIDFSKFQYRQKRNKKETSGSKSEKEYKFRAAIADNDLERKADNVVKYLEKGHTCKIIVTAARRILKVNPDAASETLDRIRNSVGHAAAEGGKVLGNKEKTFLSLTLQPNRKS